VGTRGGACLEGSVADGNRPWFGGAVRKLWKQAVVWVFAMFTATLWADVSSSLQQGLSGSRILGLSGSGEEDPAEVDLDIPDLLATPLLTAGGAVAVGKTAERRTDRHDFFRCECTKAALSLSRDTVEPKGHVPGPCPGACAQTRREFVPTLPASNRMADPSNRGPLAACAAFAVPFLRVPRLRRRRVAGRTPPGGAAMRTTA